MQFHAFEVSKEYRLQLPENYCFHLSIISASPELKKKGGHVVLYVTVDGKTFSLGTISTSQKSSISTPLQIPTDLIFTANQEVSFEARGGVPVNCIGYVQCLENGEGDDFLPHTMSDEEDSLELEESDDSDEDDFQLPIEIAMAKRGKKGGKHPRVEEIIEDEEPEGCKKKVDVDPTQVDNEVKGGR